MNGSKSCKEREINNNELNMLFLIISIISFSLLEIRDYEGVKDSLFTSC